MNLDRNEFLAKLDELHHLLGQAASRGPGAADAMDRVRADLLALKAANLDGATEARINQALGLLKQTGRTSPSPSAARTELRELRAGFLHSSTRHIRPAKRNRPAAVSRRTTFATGLAVRFLSPADRDRYRKEFAAELAYLPRRDQAPHAYRLIRQAWSLRRSLSGKPRLGPGRLVVIITPAAGGAALLSGVGWPAAALGGAMTVALAWVLGNADRTQRLAILIAAARGREPESTSTSNRRPRR